FLGRKLDRGNPKNVAGHGQIYLRTSRKILARLRLPHASVGSHRMAEKETGAMAKFGPNTPAGSQTAGLVLLYAESFRTFPAVFLLSRGTNVLGREPPASVVVPVHAVSRTHAEIVWERGGWSLKDCESTNGTLVDGRRVTEARLEHGQEVRIGDAIFKFVD